MRESIFFASIRSFFIALFAISGILVGIVLVIAIIGAISGTSEGEPDITYSFTPEIVPNADGVRKSLSSDAPVILKLNIDGVVGLDDITNKKMRQQLIESREQTFKDNRVKALLLYIDSPGGTANDADGIYRAIIAYKEKYKVPVYAFVDGLCASGGMYIACAADKITATDASLIGSVGVIMPSVLNFSQLMDKIGVQSLTIYDGKGKDNLNPLRPWKKGEEDNIKDAINNFYGKFVGIVTENRKQMDKTKLVNDYGANIYPATIAKDYGYIDEVGQSLSQVIKELAEKIGIHDDYYQVVEFQSKSWYTQLFSSEFNLLKGNITHHIQLTPQMDSRLMNQYLYLYQP